MGHVAPKISNCRIVSRSLPKAFTIGSLKGIWAARMFSHDLGSERRVRAGKRFYDALKLVKRVVHIGDVKTLACHPASTTHRQISTEEQRTAGVTPETIRLSVGIEHIDDIINDLDQALSVADSRARVA